MRIKVLTLLIALLLPVALVTGCLGGSDEPEETPGNEDEGADDGADAGDGAGDGTGDDGAGGSDGNETAPPEEEETPEDYTDSVSVSVPAGATVGDEQKTSGSAAFTVSDEGWMTFEIVVTPDSINADGVTLTVYDPEGNEAGSASFSYGDEEAQTISVSASAPGEYTIEAVANAVSGGASFTCDISVTY